MKADRDQPIGAHRSVRATFTYRVVGRGLFFAKLIVAARLLDPDEFGRFVLAAAVIGAADILSNPGVQDAVIQRPTLDERTTSVAWTLLVLRGVLVASALWLAADPIASLLAAPDIAILIRLYSLVPLVGSLAGLGPLLEARAVRVLPSMRLELVRAVVDASATVALAYTMRTAAALVWGALISVAVATLLSYTVRGPRPRIAWDRSRASSLISFGRWRFASGVFGYVATQVDDLAVGRFLGTAPLGQYRAAFTLASLPATELSASLATYALPFFSRRDPSQSHEAYARYLRTVVALAGVVAVVFLTTAGPLVRLTFGQAFAAAAVPAGIMAVAGGMRAVLATGGQWMLAVGRPELDTRMQVVRAVVLLAALPLIFVIGISGAAVASLLSILAIGPVWARAMHSTGIRAALWAPAVFGRARLLAAFLALCALPRLADVGDLGAVLLLAGGLAVGVALWPRLDRETWDELRQFRRAASST